MIHSIEFLVEYFESNLGGSDKGSDVGVQDVESPSGAAAKRKKTYPEGFIIQTFAFLTIN